MPAIPITLSALAGLEIDDSKSGIEIPTRDAIARTIVERAAELAILKPFGVGARVADALTDSLRTPLADLLKEVWKQRAELKEIAAGGKAKKVTGDVTLIDHEMKWTVKPSVEVRWAGVAMPPVKMVKLAVDVLVTVKFEGAQLEIESARITRFKSGKLTTTVLLKYKEFQLAPAMKQEIKLEGALVLPAGGIDLS